MDILECPIWEAVVLPSGCLESVELWTWHGQTDGPMDGWIATSLNAFVLEVGV